MAADSSPVKTHPARDALRLGIKALSVVLVCAAATFAVFWFVPEGGTYARATVIKHERLASIEGPKIVLVGGSNLAFGIDTRLIESATQCPVVNMGMNGFFGVRFMLEEVRPELTAGDTVVIALEYDSFFKSVDGTASNLLLVVKERPEAFDALTWRQRLELAGAMPYVAQQKILRLLRAAAYGLRDAVLGPDDDDSAPVESDLTSEVETAEGFNAEGDLVSHLGMDWPLEISQGTPADSPVDPGVIPLLRQFQDDMAARGVRVMVSYTPLEAYFYARYQSGIDGIERRMREAGLNVISPARDYVYDESFFFDTVFHVNADGRAMRSERLAQDINQFIGADAGCAGASGAEQ
ncbi:MAG: hypothetical protein K2P70_14780 [Hyphomonadaceae bacterium]|nr:hypothetical protein [Hyphomonadaceae bacterium]